MKNFENEVAIIFGSGSQDGYYLAEVLKFNRIKTLLVSRNSGDVKGDISNFEFVKSLVKTYMPNYVFHFAASSNLSHEYMFHNYGSISTGTINLLESILLYCPSSRIFISGSALQFENINEPIDESTKFECNSFYSIFRIHSVNLARYYRDNYGLRIYIGYLFNHDSPLRTTQYVNQKIVDAVLRIKSGDLDYLILNNIRNRKEFNFAGDIVNAIWLFVNQNMYSEVVIGSGLDYSIKDWVKYCFEKYNLDWERFVVVNQTNRTEPTILVSNPKRIFEIGWKPLVCFHELADLMLIDMENRRNISKKTS